jgi:hypothetical protein
VRAALVAVALLACLAPAAAGEATASCSPADYGIRLLVHRVRGGVSLQVVVGGAAVPGCVVRDTIHLSAQRSAARAHARWRPARRLEFWAPLAHSWLWRSWCGPRRAVVVSAVSPAGRDRRKVAPPPCRRGRALVDSGPSAVPRRGDVIPAHMLPPDAPVPISPSRLRATNGWLVSNGVTLVAVYAGASGGDPSVGTFAIVRQNLALGFQTVSFVDLPGTGAVRITGAPAGAAVVTSAQHADLRFAGGVLHLATDTADYGG